MINGLKPYPAVKESGVTWLGDVPTHWGMNRLGYCATLVVPMRDKPEDLSGDIPWVRIEDFNGRYIGASRSGQGVSSTAVRNMNLKVFPAGTVLCSCSCSMGATAIAKQPLVSNQTFIGIVPREGLTSEYAYWLMQVSTDHLTKIATGAIQQYLSRSEFNSLRVPLPPLSEQAAIIRFLDYADRRIRRYIRAKQRLIKLLEEQKQAIIHRAVTRGLDPNVRLRLSGVEWLGDVPQHWNLKPIGGICRYISYGFTNPMPGADSGPYMLTANDIGDGRIRYETARRTTQHAFERLLTRKSRPTLGDVLVTKDGTLGRVAVSDGQFACINQSVALLRPNTEEVIPDYLALTLRGPLYQERMALDAGGTTIKHIYITRLAKMRVGLPPIDEQLAILRNVELAISELERARTAASREIDLLREYRACLIADVVTGKLDVREAAARLPEKVDGPEPLDDAEGELDAEPSIDPLDAVAEEIET